MAGKPITVFEHRRLEVTEEGRFTQGHFDALVKYNQQHDNRFFTPEYQRIKFNQHVGVIAVGGLTIEVLPKADGLEGEEKWQRALIQMLKVAHGLPLHESGHAQLALRRTSVLEYFLRLFVEQVQHLVHHGLVKRYRKQADVTTALKGRLDLPRHIRQSIIHKERFHVVHQVYDTDHLLHTILKRALCVAEDVTTDPMTMGLAKDMQWAFEGVHDRPIDSASFDRINLDRKTNAYRDALILAKLILLNHAPDTKGGREHVISLLFDMNRLFELVVLRLLKRAAVDRPGLLVTGQTKSSFWNGQNIKPDIIIEQNGVVKCIIDTKWKLPKDDRPADPDLKQMYVYNRQYGSAESVLLYPGNKHGTERVDFDEDHEGRRGHGCSVRFIELFGANGELRLAPLSDLLEALMPSAVPLVQR